MFQIIITRTGQELRQPCGCLLNQFLIRINGENGLDALVGDGEGDIIAGLVGALEGLLYDGVAVF
jgi:hypothetical protein